MAEFITKNQLISNALKNSEIGDISLSYHFKNLEMILNKQSSNKQVVTIFLSHSHSDKKLVESTIVILSSLKVYVYVDWLDSELTFPPSGKTAIKIRRMIKENKKFILLATNDAINSKWCNWELGIGDSEKYIKNIAIIPVADNSGSWFGNEYLQIYPYINKVNKYLNKALDYEVIFPNNKKITISDWLKL